MSYFKAAMHQRSPDSLAGFNGILLLRKGRGGWMERVMEGSVKEWEGLRGDGSKQDKREGEKTKDGRRAWEGNEGDFQKFEILTASML